MVLPFVVDHAGGIDAVLQDVLGCSGQQAECNLGQARDLSSWSESSKGFSNFFLQSLTLANLEYLGHLFMVTAASVRAAS